MPEAYCGPAPVPQALLGAWNLDPVAMGLCAVLAVARLRGRERHGRAPLAIAVALLLILFVSPFCALTVALFSARVAHHVLLVSVAAPILALAFPEQERAARRVPLVWLVGAHAALLWFWHAPPVYEAGISTALPYWAMQGTLLASAFFLWRRILSSRTATGPALLALTAAAVQMGMLGALLTFAREPLYAAHLATTLPWGLTSLADQQLGGLIMWVPASLPWLIAALVLLSRAVDRPATRIAR